MLFREMILIFDAEQENHNGFITIFLIFDFVLKRIHTLFLSTHIFHNRRAQLTRAYLFLLDEGKNFVTIIQNNWVDYYASYGV